MKAVEGEVSLAAETDLAGSSTSAQEVAPIVEQAETIEEVVAAAVEAGDGVVEVEEPAIAENEEPGVADGEVPAEEKVEGGDGETAVAT